MLILLWHFIAFLVISKPVSAGCWKPVAPIGTGPRLEHGAAAVGKDIYIVGGLVNGTIGSTLVERFDSAANKWSSVPPLPRPLHHSNVAAVNGKLFVLGGMVGVDGWPAVGSSFSYDPATQKWEQLESLPDPRGAAAVGVWGNTVYLAGGSKAKGNPTPKLSAFDTMVGKWTRMPHELAEGRDHVGGAVIGDTFYVVGGRINGQLRNTTFALNLKQPDKWASLASMPTGRAGMGVAALGSKLYTFGGEGNRDTASRGVFNNTEVFDTETKKWVEEVPMRKPRHGVPATTIGASIYLVGGGTKQGMGDDVDIADSFSPGPCT